jgi:hypothetical protein
MSVPAEQWDNTERSRYNESLVSDEAILNFRIYRDNDNSTRVDIISDDQRVKFQNLAEQWRNETGHISNMLYKYMNRNYQKIIAKGPDVIPLILEELQTNPNHWFWALEVITNENPVKQEHTGYIDLMAGDWIEWGISKGYLLP